MKTKVLIEKAEAAAMCSQWFKEFWKLGLKVEEEQDSQKAQAHFSYAEGILAAYSVIFKEWLSKTKLREEAVKEYAKEKGRTGIHIMEG
jgi:hypothetical protein